MAEFDTLTTEQFRVRMRPHAINIYKGLFGESCKVNDLRADGVGVHVLDKEFAIDTLLTMPSGQWISLQEKYRDHKFLVGRGLREWPDCPDFTQEYKNAHGTPQETPGEWFKLGAQFYFYGWAKTDCSGFESWLILDIPRYKLLVEKAGGLAAVGTLHMNKKHGRASFYAIPILNLSKAWAYHYNLSIGQRG